MEAEIVNDKKKYYLLVIAIVMTIAVLFPPFYIVAQDGLTVNAGFHFILTGNDPAIVNIGQLFMEWLFISSIGFIGWFVFKDKQ
jgi:hypothetical protein